jgi:NAD-dependent DNA ligase
MTNIERDMVRGMTSILNEAIAANKSGNPIMTDEQFDTRLNDLIELENDISFILINSPTQKDRKPINTSSNFKAPVLVNYNTVDDVIKFSNNKELTASINLNGSDMSLVYKDGVLSEIKTNDTGIKKYIKQFENMPLKIKKDGIYIISGKAFTLKEKLKFYGHDIIEGGNDNLFDNLRDAENLGFDVVPYWIMSTINPKKFQNNVDYMYEYADEDCLPYSGVIFRYNDIEYSNSLPVIDNYRNGIIYN